jgi:hypothetical protein
MTKYETLRNRINAADGAFCALTQIQNLCWALEFILTVKKVEDAHDAARTALSQKGINRGDSADLTIAYMAGYNNASIRHEDEIERLREALREIAEGDRPDNDEQFCVGYWGATARAALGEGKE